jgi:cytochrome d ubiquinol oxidase subunit I
MLLAAVLLRKGRVFRNRFIMWMMMILAPMAYIANLAGWYTAELSRQPWLVYGLLKTSEGISPHVSSGNTLFTLLGFIGLYLLLGILFVVIVMKIILKGPEKQHV